MKILEEFMFRKIMVPICVAAVLGLFQGCGGGGGDGDSEFYAGIWRFSGVKVQDSCNVSSDSTASLTLTVNQVDERVVVDAGSAVLEGELNNDGGFSVSRSTYNNSNGCVTGTALVFENVSDGEAEAGLAIVAECPGATGTCILAYGGQATRLSGGRFSYEASGDFIEEIAEELTDMTASMNEVTERRVKTVEPRAAAEQIAVEAINAE
jgi:hypothetical protein